MKLSDLIGNGTRIVEGVTCVACSDEAAIEE